MSALLERLEAESPTQMAKKTAIVGAVWTLLTSIVYFVTFFTSLGRRPSVSTMWDPKVLEDRIEHTISTAGFELFVSLMSVIGSMIVTHVVWVISRLYSKEKSALPQLAWFSWLGGLIFAFTAFLLFQGGLQSLRRTFYTLDPTQGVEYVTMLVSTAVTADVVLGQGGALNVAQVVLLAFTVGSFSYMTMWGAKDPSHRLSRLHGLIGWALVADLVFLIIMSIIDFSVKPIPGEDAGRVTLAIFTGISGALSQYILFPAWIIKAGFELSHMTLPGHFSDDAKPLVGAGDSSYSSGANNTSASAAAGGGVSLASSDDEEDDL